MLGPVGKAVNSARARVGLRPLVWGAILTVVAVGLDFVPLYDTVLVRPADVPHGDVVLLASGSAAREACAREFADRLGK